MINSVLLVMALGLPATEGPQSGSPVRIAPAANFQTDEAPFVTPADWIVRGQDTVTTPALTVPLDGSTSSYYQPGMPYPGTMSPGMTYPGTADPFTQSYPAPITQDPWLGGSVNPYAAPMGGYPGLGWGVNGPQPHRFGWSAKYDFEYLVASDTGMDDLTIFGANVEKRWTTPAFNNWVFSMAPQFNYRGYEGPIASGNGNDLPGSVYRLGLDLNLKTPQVYGWSWEFGFTPALATDFQQVDADGVLFDGKIVAYWTWDPTLTWVLGAEYWDRVDDLIIPHAGLVWTPDQYWEFQLVVPKPKISVFLGAPAGIATWLYARAEYHVEAYQIESTLGGDTRMQVTDGRVLGGLKWEAGWFGSFIEAGYVFERQVEFDGIATGFDVDSGFIARAGLSY